MKLDWQTLETKLEPFGRLVFYVVLFHALVLTYWPAMKAPFVYDDVSSIIHNADLRHPTELGRFFSRHSTSMKFDQRPVAGLVTLANYQVCGLAVAGFRLVNLFIHWATAIVLCEFIILFGQVTNLGAVRVGACGIAALWALHPLNSITVIFISARSESMMSFFYVLTMYCFLKSFEAERLWPWLLASAISFAAALGSKEIGLTLIVAIPLLLSIVSANVRAEIQRRLPYFLALAAIWMLFVAWWAGGPRIKEITGGVLGDPWVYFKAQCGYVINYLKLVCWPDPLIFVYSPVYPDRLSAWLPHAVVLIFAAAFVFVAGRTIRWVILPGLLFFIILAPSSSFLPIPSEPAAEWRMYLPSACVLALAVGLLGRAARAYPGGLNLALKLLLVVVGVSAMVTMDRASVYASAISLWQDNAQKQPLNYKALANLSIARLGAGQHEAARVGGSGLITIGEHLGDPTVQGIGWQILGMIAADHAEPQEALTCYERALALDEKLDKINAQISYVLIALDRIPEAVDYSRKALAASPEDPFVVLTAADAFSRAQIEPDAGLLFKKARKISREEPGFEKVRKRIEEPGEPSQPTG